MLPLTRNLLSLISRVLKHECAHDHANMEKLENICRLHVCMHEFALLFTHPHLHSSSSPPLNSLLTFMLLFWSITSSQQCIFYFRVNKDLYEVRFTHL